MNTYRNISDALTAARNNYGGRTEPEALVVLRVDNAYSAVFAEKMNDATSINYQRGLLGIWGEQARQAYRNQMVAINSVVDETPALIDQEQRL